MLQFMKDFKAILRFNFHMIYRRFVHAYHVEVRFLSCLKGI